MGYKKYTTEDVLNALEAVENGESLREAAKLFKIPFPTLHLKHTGVYHVETKL